VKREPRAAELPDLAIIVWAVLAVVLQVAAAPTAVRAPVVISFLLFAPGFALLRRAGLAGGPQGLAMAISVSIGAAVVLSTALVYAGAYSVEAGLWTLAAVTILMAVSPLVWRGRRQGVPHDA
jgi:uncharacterized membrane protein